MPRPKGSKNRQESEAKESVKLSVEELNSQMVVLKLEGKDKGGADCPELKVKHEGKIHLLVPGKNSKMMTRSAANHIIAKSKHWEVKPILKIVELRPANELEPEEEESNAGDAEGDA